MKLVFIYFLVNIYFVYSKQPIASLPCSLNPLLVARTVSASLINMVLNIISILLLIVVIEFDGCSKQASAIQLQTDPQDACVAYGNGTTYNVTGLDWPYVFTDSRN